MPGWRRWSPTDSWSSLVDAVPAAWLDGDAAFASRATTIGAAYVDYLRRRLVAPRAFVEEAERARTGA